MKRGGDGGGGGGAKRARSGGGSLVHPRRWRVLKKSPAGGSGGGAATATDGDPPAKGPVVYWCSRDQRVLDNWALLHAAEEALVRDAPLAVAFALAPAFLGAGARQYGFMLRGLREMERNLRAKGVPFFLLQHEGGVKEAVPAFVKQHNASLLVTDFSPLRLGREWREAVAKSVDVDVHEVDAHNVVPVWEPTDKLEYAARTIRPKITKLLPEYLVEFPELPQTAAWDGAPPPTVDWDGMIARMLKEGKKVPEVRWCVPGETAARAALLGDPDAGKEGFLPKRLLMYEQRNDPNKPAALSGLSPYLHFGQLASQRAVLEAQKLRGKNPKAVDSFIEEIVVRKELSDNFCLHNPNYDSIKGASDWAKETLQVHASDKREHLYTRQQLEEARTHDDLWNAAQIQLVEFGKMHGFLRMYWAKKILEWTATPEDALADAIYLNDTYSLDGRDPNGYVGCMWSVCGIHDMGWKERPVFGKIRYMNYDGCKRKFNVAAFVQQTKREVVAELKAKQQAAAAKKAAKAEAAAAK